MTPQRDSSLQGASTSFRLARRDLAKARDQIAQAADALRAISPTDADDVLRLVVYADALDAALAAKANRLHLAVFLAPNEVRSN